METEKTKDEAKPSENRAVKSEDVETKDSDSDDSDSDGDSEGEDE